MYRTAWTTVSAVALALVAPGCWADEEEKPKKMTADVVYVATPHDVVERMLRMVKVTKDDVVYDLGCGDGRIVVSAAKRYGCRGIGFDIDDDRVKESRENIKKNKSRMKEIMAMAKKDRQELADVMSDSKENKA